MSAVDDLMSTVTRLGNDELVAQAVYAMEAAGLTPTPELCKAAFLGAAHVIELAEKLHDVDTYTTVEMLAATGKDANRAPKPPSNRSKTLTRSLLSAKKRFR